MNKVFDCIVIGGGPSGLAAGNLLAKAGIDFLVIDKGDYLYKRNQEIPKDIVTGIGGGGLYSDGKISFFPSGSNLYNLEPELLKKSYQQLVELFQNFAIEIPRFDSDWLNQKFNS
ncbi:MAG: FAD-dependent monooxygenase, partial [Bacteroidetes bacterium]|nr:FAD-dependent monooxygenase [Bacteroidota bacterium]